MRSTVWYKVFPGLVTQEPVGDVPFDPQTGKSYLYQANNVYSPSTSGVIRKRPGFTKVRATTISTTGIITGMFHMSEIADEFILGVSIAGTSHNLYRDNANPPGAIAAGTNFTNAGTNLLSMVNFTDGTNPGLVIASRSRDTPQFVTGTVVRSDFIISSTTLPQYLEVFGQRLLFGAPSVSGTVQDDRVYWSDIRAGKTITDITTQFESFETESKDKVRAIKKLSDICLVGKLNNCFLLATNPAATKPFANRELPGGRYRGPVSHQGVVEAQGRLYWMGQNNIHSLGLDGSVNDHADAIKPTILSLQDTMRQYTIAGYDGNTDYVVFAVAVTSTTANDTVIALNVKTGALYLWTHARNAYAQRLVPITSGDSRLIGGGSIGFFYNEMTGTAGDLDDATAVIDADVLTPRYWTGYGTKQKIPYVLLSVDPIGTESITVQYRLDDATAWTTPAESPIVVSGTDNLVKAVHIDAWAERIQLRIRNNTAAEVYSIKGIGLPMPVLQPLVV